MKKRKIKSISMLLILSIIIAFNYNQASAQEHKVLIDPGHGGRDKGSSHGSYIEEDINLQIANEVSKALKKANIDVEMTRTDDTYVSLAERAKISNESDADIFISIHQNGSENANSNGFEIFYMKEDGKELAEDVHESVLGEINPKDRGIKKGNLQVLRDNEKTSILIECGFISNQNEGYRLSTKGYQEKIAKGIVEGVKEYLGENEADSEVSLGNAVCLNDVNVMSDRGSDFEVLGTLKEGSSVEIIDTKFDWHKIKYNGGYGYVSAVYVK